MNGGCFAPYLTSSVTLPANRKPTSTVVLSWVTDSDSGRSLRIWSPVDGSWYARFWWPDEAQALAQATRLCIRIEIVNHHLRAYVIVSIPGLSAGAPVPTGLVLHQCSVVTGIVTWRCRALTCATHQCWKFVNENPALIRRRTTAFTNNLLARYLKLFQPSFICKYLT
jgi:hypothetical protein